jgi:small-conductance mechanosensitive channel
MQPVKEFIDTVLSNILTKFLVSILIMLVGFILGKLAGKILHKILSEIKLNDLLKKIRIYINVEHLLSSFITYFIFLISIIMGLNQMGVTSAILNIVSLGIIALIAISMVLAIKDFFPNFFAGLHIFGKKLLNVGDIIKYKQIEGEIIEITLLETIVITKSKDLIYIPNVNFLKNEVVIRESHREMPKHKM